MADAAQQRKGRGPVQAGKSGARHHPPLARGPRGRRAVGVGHLGRCAGGVLGGAGLGLQRLWVGLGRIVEVEVAQGAARQALGIGEPRVGIFGRELRHGDAAGHQLRAGLGADVGARDAGLAAADEDPQAEVARFLALDLFQLAQAHGDRKGAALSAHSLGGVRASGQRLGHQVVQQVFVHPGHMAERTPRDKPSGSRGLRRRSASPRPRCRRARSG